MKTPDFGALLRQGLAPPSMNSLFVPLVDGIRHAITSLGIAVDRIQLPMTTDAGFRHPTLALVVITWDRDSGFDNIQTVSHAENDRRGGIDRLRSSPFQGIVTGEVSEVFVEDLGLITPSVPFLTTLQSRGYRGYLAMGLPMPGGFNQPLSIASQTPYNQHTLDEILARRDLLAMTVYSSYRHSQAERVARVYIGPKSGPRVLDGEIRRGRVHTVDAGILFCDIRNFTPLSQKLGAERIVELVNDLFAVIGEEAERRGGEILKFIGDAMLIVFDAADPSNSAAQAMVDTAAASAERIRSMACGIDVGFGGHVGKVVQGNLGTENRLDFTVMGPAVNLASRLESLSKTLGVTAVFSDAVIDRSGRLVPAGPQQVKGVEEVVEVSVLDNASLGVPPRD
ncbi:MAG: adenylate/guanylate cyclase domain-containing protein [Myxococcota bacterium]|nr:adenylate/guanylate cyclase domain-containing protein [Myxococcota bacterium]